jgi:hypothetical protein
MRETIAVVGSFLFLGRQKPLGLVFNVSSQLCISRRAFHVNSITRRSIMF